MAGNTLDLLASTRPDISKLPGGWEPTERLLPHLSESRAIVAKKIGGFDGITISNALTSEDCQQLIWLMKQSPNTEGVSVQGRKDVPDYRMGSVRTTLWAPSLALQFWRKIGHLIPTREMTPVSATDWWQGNKTRTKWVPVGMSPLLRFMRYTEGGQHYSHYDAGFIYPDDNLRTLQSVVIYLTTNPVGGATRFVKDTQGHLPVWNRSHLDWVREAEDAEILFKSQPEQGKMLIFDHRICHDVEMYRSPDPRIIIRADIVFRAGGKDGTVEN